MTKVRLKKCKICNNEFNPRNSLQKCCSMDCALVYAKADQQKRQVKQERKELKEKKEALKTKSDWLKKLQAVFNRYIRLRDKDQPCISCGRYHQGKYDAGHYRSVGAYPELRFNEDNVHRQCVPCNQYKGGNGIEYRLGLIERIGLERVEFLERKDHPPLKLSNDEIKALIKMYKEKCKGLE